MEKDALIFKIILVGDMNVGKTCIVRRFADGTFEENCGNTVGVDFKIKHLVCRSKSIKLQIWDTAGDQRYRNMANMYFKGAHGVILVYDLTSESSFESVKFWYQTIREKTSEGVPALLIGNKADLPRVVTKQKALQMAQCCKMSYVQTSAKTANNVQEVFKELCEKILDRQDERSILKGKSIPLKPIQRPGENSSYCSC